MRRLFILVGSLVLAVTACTDGRVKPLPAAPEVKVLPTTTTFPDFSGTSIPPVGGTTTIPPISLRGGTSSFTGRVTVDGAPSGGINVHIDRFVGDASAGADTLTANDGTYSFRGLLGGRYRIRAWRTPDATLNTPVTLFLNAGQAHAQNLNLAKINGGLNFLSNIAPNPPRRGDVANIVVQVTTRGVDNAGVAKSIGQGGLPITLITTGPAVITTANPMVTNASGSAVWTIRCDGVGPQAYTAVLPDGAQSNLTNLPSCQLPPATTTTTITPAPVPPPAPA